MPYFNKLLEVIADLLPGDTAILHVIQLRGIPNLSFLSVHGLRPRLAQNDFLPGQTPGLVRQRPYLKGSPLRSSSPASKTIPERWKVCP